MVIAIDGPAGAGKTSTARAVAKGLGYFYLDSGALYRAITYAVLSSHAVYSEKDVNQLVEKMDVSLQYADDLMEVYVNDKDVTHHLRSAEINANVSIVASFEAVRSKLVNIQRSVAAEMQKNGYGVVVDGRDIGTVVFPEADLKFFLIASPEVRARRRYNEVKDSGKGASYQEILASVNERDKIDSTRKIAPLKKAEDAIVIDTSTISFDEQVMQVIDAIKERQIKHDV